jgi:hypothetical protein
LKRLALVICVLIALPLAPALAQPAPASPQELAAITQRGRALEAYDHAAWHGTDAAQAAAHGDTTGLEVYVARQTPAGWVVDFGKLDSSGSTFLTAIEAQSTDGLHFTAARIAPARSDTGFLVGAAHAIKTAQAAFTPISGYKYNVAVLPNPDGTMYVYLYPAQSDPKIFPVGGDERFTVSTDRTKIVEAHRMHNSILAQNMNGAVAGVRSVVVANVPQDTDVFHVLARTPPIPDYIVAQGQMYKINTDGTIQYQGPAGAKP